jgi:hypothetical protein
MMRAGRWIWFVVVALALIAGAVVAVVLSRRGDKLQPPPLAEQLRSELEAVKAANAAERLAAEVGYRQAIEHIEMQQKEALDALDEEQQQQATELRADPAALSAFLVRAARDKRPR